MNRPKFEDYKWKYTTQWKYDVFGYRANVEKYCDELEASLDRACKILDKFGYAMPLPYCNNQSKEQWKEYLLNNE